MDAAVAGHVCYFDEEDAALTAGGVSYETRDDTGDGLLLCDFFIEPLDAEDFFEFGNGDVGIVFIEGGCIFGVCVLNGFVAADGADFTLEIAHARFARIGCDDSVDNIVR